MKTNKFDQLNPEDQQLLLKICEDNPYHVAARIVAKPRSEGGLNLATSRSALNRFYTHHHPDQRSLEMLGQYADAVRIKGQAHSGAALEALYTLVQNRLIDALKNGKSLSELDRDFRTLERVQHCFHNEEKRRKQIGAAAEQAYRDHLELLALAPNPDFIRKDLAKDPGAGSVTQDDFDNHSDLDLAIAATNAKLSAPPQNAGLNDSTILSLLKTLQVAMPPASPSASPASAAPILSKPVQTPKPTSNPAPKTAKAPVIPHIPPNPTSPIPLL